MAKQMKDGRAMCSWMIRAMVQGGGIDPCPVRGSNHPSPFDYGREFRDIGRHDDGDRHL
ncbi:MAG: hypothetical protein IJR99_06685 [Kiritimatiellae bacterium]|nr:hypothetical protein [Kiritimatiellia bacterium]